MFRFSLPHFTTHITHPGNNRIECMLRFGTKLRLFHHPLIPAPCQQTYRDSPALLLSVRKMGTHYIHCGRTSNIWKATDHTAPECTKLVRTVNAILKKSPYDSRRPSRSSSRNFVTPILSIRTGRMMIVR